MELLEKLHSGYPHVAFLMATGVADVRVGVQAMKQGADDYLLKPFDMDVVLASLGRALQRKQLEREVQNYRKHLESMVAERTQQLEIAMSQLERSYSATLEALGSAIDLRDSATAGHARRVLWYSIKLANTLGGLEDQLKNIAMGACLHDIGKLATPDGILLKPGALSDQERKVMQRHVVIGYDLVKGIPFLAEAAEIILAHHERWDGSGYPRGLRGDEIPLSARIFAVADTLDAITSDRPYRAALQFSAARDVIARESGKLFDSVVADAFLGIPEESWASISAEAATKVISSVFALSDQSLASTPGFHLPLCFPRLHATPERRDA
jgi:putative nucleotidyltransferase with HDIG domain